MPLNHDALLVQVLRAAQKAGQAVMDYYNNSLEVTLKSDHSPLTLADQVSHKIIFEALTQAGPYPILSEEGRSIPYSERMDWNAFWLVDPLDGTKEFINQNGEFTVNIALIEKGHAVLGVIYVPAKKITYFASTDIGSYKSSETLPADGDLKHFLKNSQRLNGKDHSIEDGVLRVVASRSHLTQETSDYIKELCSTCQSQIVSAGSSLKFCLLAEGKADVYPRFSPTMEWDTAAGQAIVEQAGGKVVNHETGGPLHYNKVDLHNPWFVASKTKN